MSQTSDYAGYTLYHSTEPAYPGECTREDALRIASEAEVFALAEFPGITVELWHDRAGVCEVTGPHSTICNEIVRRLDIHRRKSSPAPG